MTRLVTLLLPLSPIVLAACGELECDAMAVASVQLEVVDEAGQPIAGAVAEFTILEEDWAEPQPCDEVGEGELVCGWEVEGSLEILVEAEGYASEFVEAVVLAEECHVVTEMLEVELMVE